MTSKEVASVAAVVVTSITERLRIDLAGKGAGLKLYL